MTELPLAQQRCKVYDGDQSSLTDDQVDAYSAQINSEWTISQDRKLISRRFTFKNYYQTIAFVNAVAWIANSEDHHPDMNVTYRHCEVQYTTHSLGGLSPNDFICAAKIDELVN